MPINKTRSEIGLQIDSQTIKQSQLLVEISQSNHQTVQFHRLNMWCLCYHIDLSKVSADISPPYSNKQRKSSLSEAKINRRPVLTQTTYTPRPTSWIKTNAAWHLLIWSQWTTRMVASRMVTWTITSRDPKDRNRDPEIFEALCLSNRAREVWLWLTTYRKPHFCCPTVIWPMTSNYPKCSRS